ncbi:helix-turn-helix domain-containing protein [Microvirga sp. P5_D2]
MQDEIPTKQGRRPDKFDEISLRLRQLRLAMGFIQKRAWCNFIGAHEPSWHVFENGNRRITIDEALKVCDRTGVSLDWIYRGLEHTLPLHVAEKLRLNLAAADKAAERDWLDLTPSKRKI